MSQENVERLRAWLEVWDLDDLANGVFDSSLVDPDCTYEDAILPDHAGEIYRGYERMSHAGRVWLEPFETYSVELERVVDCGEFVMSLHRFRATFKRTGIEFDLPLAWFYTFQDGRITRWRAFPSESEALEAAGLSE
jgi:ketosteroid isomerase-like protein